jgi:hypothetical protein
MTTNNKQKQNKINKTILILDSKWEDIYNSFIQSWYNKDSFPVKKNIDNPMNYFLYIVNNKPDYIILWNWFKNKNWFDEALWWKLLSSIMKSYLKKEVKKKKFLWFTISKEEVYTLSWFHSKIVVIWDNQNIILKLFPELLKIEKNINFIDIFNIKKHFYLFNK